MSPEVADVDGNASWDLIRIGREGITVTWTETTPQGSVTLLNSETIDSRPTIGLQTWNYDNDGLGDLLVWGDGGLRGYRGGADGHFRKVEGLFAKKVDAVQA